MIQVKGMRAVAAGNGEKIYLLNSQPSTVGSPTQPATCRSLHCLHSNPKTMASHTFMDYSSEEQSALSGLIVPQKVYVPPTAQALDHPVPPIRFSVQNRPGVRLQDALNYPVPGLDSANTIPDFDTRATRVTMRILWPGYEVWTAQNSIQLLDGGLEVNPRNKEHIAFQVARLAQAFYNEMSHNASTEPDWALQRYPFAQFYLLELRKVSTGTWQPVFLVDV